MTVIRFCFIHNGFTCVRQANVFIWRCDVACFLIEWALWSPDVLVRVGTPRDSGSWQLVCLLGSLQCRTD